MAAIPLDVMLWIAGGVWTLGALALIPIWWRGRARRAGRVVGFTDQDVIERNVALGFLTLGTGLGLTSGLMMVSQNVSFGAFMALCGVGCAAILFIAFTVDGRRARRQR